jgi:hypothetical protein
MFIPIGYPQLNVPPRLVIGNEVIAVLCPNDVTRSDANGSGSGGLGPSFD